MANNKTRIKIRYIILSIVIILLLVLIVPFIVLQIRTASLESEYGYLKSDSNYNTRVILEDVPLVTQEISCGYATIEMISSYYGNAVTEESLGDKNNGKISTSTTKGFLNEINSSISSKSFSKKTYLKGDELLKQLYTSLSNGNPVAIEWAAQNNGEWTLHFSVVVGMDLENDLIIINNPYGYIEELTMSEFLNRTSFSTYDNMPLFLQFGFAFGMFHKNTIFIVG